MIELLHMNCMEYMAGLPDKAFDLAIVDPEYGIDVANMKMGIGKSKKASKIHNRKWKSKDWDKSIPDESYFYELFRVSGNQIIWGGNYFPLSICKHFIVWDKQIPEGLSFSDCEFAWTSFEKANRIFRYSAYLDKISKFHPTQKPIKLYRWLLHNYAQPGDRILDTHLGSGSSAIAAHQMGFNFVGTELDKDYYEAAVKRFNNAKMQQTLF